MKIESEFAAPFLGTMPLNTAGGNEHYRAKIVT